MLHLVDDNGKLLYQKKLDFEPMSLLAYNIEDIKYQQNKTINLMYMLATSNDHVLVYKGQELAWALKY